MKEPGVLLVDDEKEFVETLAHRLRMRDVRVRTAHSGPAALAALEEEQPHIVLLDLKMPGMDGLEVLRRVRKLYPDLDVIILTGHGGRRDEETARNLGAYDYMKKPVSLEELLPRLKKVIKRKLAHREKQRRTPLATTFTESGPANEPTEDGPSPPPQD